MLGGVRAPFSTGIALGILRVTHSRRISSAVTVEDLVQDVFEKLLEGNYRLLREFRPQEPDSIIGYLKVIAGNTTRDRLRASKADKRGGNTVHHDDSVLDRIASATPGRTSDTEWNLQLREIDDVLQFLVPEKLAERDRTIFWLYFRQGYSARDVSLIRSFGLSEKVVESAIHRTSRELRASMGNNRRFAEKGVPPHLALSKETL